MSRQIPKLDVEGKPILGEDGRPAMTVNTARDIWITATTLITAKMIVGIGVIGGWHYRYCEYRCRHPHLLPLELVDARDLRDQGHYLLAGMGHQLLGGGAVQEPLVVEVVQRRLIKKTLRLSSECFIVTSDFDRSALSSLRSVGRISAIE